MLGAVGSPLVPGTPQNAMSKQVSIKVLRPFCIKGEPVKVGAKLEVDPALAVELISLNKAERVPDAPAKQPKE